MENQFTLATGVTGVDDYIDVLFASERQDVLEAVGTLFDWLELEFFGMAGRTLKFQGRFLPLGRLAF